MLKASLAALMLMPQFGSSKRIHKKWAMMGRFIQGLFIMSILAPMPLLGSYYCYCTVLLYLQFATKILLTTSILFFWLPTKFFGMDWFPILFIIPNASKKLLKFQKMWVTYLRTCRPIILCWIIFITYVITTWINLCMSYLFFNFLKLLCY